MFKRLCEMTDEDRVKVGEMSGKLIQWMLEGRSIGYMSEKLNLHPKQVEYNIEETLYTLKCQVGKWRYIKMLFRK